MKDENKIHPLQGEQKQNSHPVEGPRAGSGSIGKRLLAKKWVFPAAYMAAAAIILTLMWVYQDSVSTPVAEDRAEVATEAGVTGDVQEQQPAGQDQDALPAAAEAEALSAPVRETSDLQVVMGFFDVNGTNEDNQAAMVEYGDTFTPHYGIDYASQNNESFEVLAAMSGTVIRVESIPVAGRLIEISHPNGLSTVYQSVDQIQVAEGDAVKQGDVIARAGRNELEKDLGIHLHYEVWENGQPVDPEQYDQ